jgi:hypothetical protein
MLILISIILLLITIASMLVIRALRPRFLYHWLIAVGGAFSTWVVMLVAGFQIPLSVPLIEWGSQILLRESPLLLADQVSWPFAFALVTLALAIFLTDAARAAEADWSAWAGTLALAALGIFAVLAGNPLTLLLGWMAIDLAELLILLSQVSKSEMRERAVIAFSARIFGSLLLISAFVVAAAGDETLAFESVPVRASLFLVLAAGLRLGVLPLHVPFFQELPIRRGLGTMSRLVPGAAGLILLVRTAGGLAAPLEFSILIPLLVLAALAGLYGGLAWFLADDELDGRPAWILAIASLCLAATIMQKPQASLAWALSGLFSGGLLFLTSIRNRRLAWLSLLGLISISALPYTPSWNGVFLFLDPFQPLLSLFLITHALLLAGYARHALQPGPSLLGVERWIWLIYPLGLLLLPLTHFLIGWWILDSPSGFPVLVWILGFVALGLAALLIFIGYKFWDYTSSIHDLLREFLSLNWFYRFLWFTYRYLRRFSAFITSIFEGEGGILWAFLILILLLSVIASGNGGG